MNFFGLEDKTFFAEDVLAGVEGILGDGEVHVERSGDQDGVDALVGEQLAVVLELFGLGADDLGTLAHVWFVDIADGDTGAVVEPFKMLQQVLPTATSADEAILHRIIRSLHL